MLVIRLILIGLCVHFSVAVRSSAESITAPTEASYLFQSAGEGQSCPPKGLLISVAGQENVDGRLLTWWQMTIQTRKGERYGVRLLSEGVPLTRNAKLGHVERYFYCDAAGKTYEYLDETTGKALLPVLRFEDAFLPQASHDASYSSLFASAGNCLGHPVIQTAPLKWLEPLSFENPKTLILRNDLLMAGQVRPCYDTTTDKNGKKVDKHRLCNREELAELIDAGINLLQIYGPDDYWLVEEPVFFAAGSNIQFPDWFYRSNYFPGSMYLDEPSIRFGWEGHIPKSDLQGPEQLANALRQRVAVHYRSQDLKIPVGEEEGTLDLHYNKCNSWDTHYFSAWQEMAGGAPSLVFEGRYQDLGYGWSPNWHFGNEGLESLTLVDQLNCVHGFMRGAARAFNGDWGTSYYPEGKPEYYDQAFYNAYDLGARYLWFWVHIWPEGHNINHETLVSMGKKIQEYIKQHPRKSRKDAIEAGKLGIVFPKGYIYTEGSIMGFDANQASPEGATYGDISSAALFEGILASQRGTSFDFLNDEPRILDLGYERLVYVRPNGSVDAVPPWPEERPANGLKLRLEKSTDDPIAKRAPEKADYEVPRAKDIQIDGDLKDWDNIPWISLGTDVRGTLQQFEAVVDHTSAATATYDFKNNYLGFEWKQLTTDYQLKYHLEDYYILGDRWIPPAPGIHDEKQGIVITKVVPGSPIDRAGIREGDILDNIGEKRTKYEFQVHEWLMMHKRTKELTFKLTRSGHELVGKPGDLGGEVALAVDDKYLYIAARITDDIHAQANYGVNFWQGDCIHFGFDTILARGDNGYQENDHEIALALYDGRSIAYRSHGRTGQAWGELKDADVKIIHENGKTYYEAAIPLDELKPLSPGLWSTIGFNAVVSDNDGVDLTKREGRLELREGAMTRGKNGKMFATLHIAPPPDPVRVSGALFWKRRATPQNGFFQLKTAVYSPKRDNASLIATLQSLDSPNTPAIVERLVMPVTPEPVEQILTVETQSPPGRYALQVWIEDGYNGYAASDRLPVYVFPAAQDHSQKQ